jgi:tetratricopeptide (TPR) repeat protein
VAARPWSLLLYAAVGAAVGTLIYWSNLPPAKDAPSSTPVPVVAPAHRQSDDAAIFAKYAGSQACRECHAAQFDPWKHSHHGLAERALDPKRDDVAFSPSQTVKHASQTSVVSKRDAELGARGAGNGEAQYVIETLGADGRVGPHVVQRVIGEKPLWQFIVDAAGEGRGAGDSGLGGGSAPAEPVAPNSAARIVVPDANAKRAVYPRQQVLELCYDPAKHEWFNVYGDEDRKPGEWGHWTGRGMNWNSQCASCHNTRVKKNYDPATDTYATTMAEPTVSCEACHGPMRDHVDWQRANPAADRIGDASAKGFASQISPNPESRILNPSTDPTLKKFTSTQWLAICGSCHARQTDMTGDFVPGDNYFDHYSLAVPDLSETFYADGQIREEDYEFTSFMSSRMYASGVNCLHCHDPHAAKPLLGDNALCMKCHNGSFPKSPKIDIATHTFHAAESTGSKCVNCHMPQTVYMQRHWRHDHGFTIPDPLLTKQHGIPNACNRCHEDKDADWSLAAVEKWYGEKMNRPTRRRAQIVAAMRKAPDAQSDEPLLAMLRDKENVFWQASAADLLGSGVMLPRPEVQQALVESTQHGFALVREKAIQSLEPLISGSEPRATAAAEKLLDDPARSVRIAAAWALRNSAREDSRAVQDLVASLRHLEDRAEGAFMRGQWEFARRETDAAVRSFELAVKWDPGSPDFRHNLAVGYSTQKRRVEAVRQMQEAVKLAPENPEYWMKLGLGWADLQDPRQAIAAMQKAVEIEPRYTQGWLRLAETYVDFDRPAEAIAAFTQVEKLSPQGGDIPFALAQLYLRTNQKDKAREAAARAVRKDPEHHAAKQLLEALRGKD